MTRPAERSLHLTHSITLTLLVVCATATGAAQPTSRAPTTLPETAIGSLVASLASAKGHARHIWRDTPPFNGDGTVNAYIEIPRGERRKWEFDMRANARELDRVIPVHVGPYPVNYGYVPQTISYDGDPFDALVLGPPLAGGRLARGVIVGLMIMEDEKGVDSKVVLSPVNRDGRPVHALTSAEQQRIADYFNRYKRHEPGKFSRVPGWGTSAEGREHIDVTHAFFERCRDSSGRPCIVRRAGL